MQRLRRLPQAPSAGSQEILPDTIEYSDGEEEDEEGIPNTEKLEIFDIYKFCRPRRALNEAGIR